MELLFLLIYVAIVTLLAIFLAKFLAFTNGKISKKQLESISTGDLIRIRDNENKPVYGRLILIDRVTGRGLLKSSNPPYELHEFKDYQTEEKL